MPNSEEQFFENLVNGDHRYKVDAFEAEGESDEVTLSEKPSDGGLESEGKLTIDVYQTPAEIIVESAIAGVKPEDIDISVSSDSITIRGERRHDEEIRDEDYFYQECYWGRFSRSVILPEEVDPDNASVSFKNGVLKVKLPKLNRKKTKKLKVKVE
ncbi:MAG: Hsp20/alpha crystallin family protein [Candidatus Liptonbacteria bacterium]|nr:Hsp20/alpha crystallin family protein [Candidatus Liptonbacteria bacterium]